MKLQTFISRCLSAKGNKGVKHDLCALCTNSVYNVSWTCVITSSLLQTKARSFTTAVSHWSGRAASYTRELEYFHSSDAEHQEMIGDPLEQEDKSYSVSHILSPFPSLTPSLQQLSWLMCAHSCPNHCSLDMTKAGTEEGNRGGSASGSLTGGSVGPSGGREGQLSFVIQGAQLFVFTLRSAKSLFLWSRDESLFPHSTATQHKHMDWRTNNS